MPPLPAPNYASALGYSFIVLGSWLISWWLRDDADREIIIAANIAIGLIFGSCSLHHFGHAIDAPWSPVATALCGLCSFLAGFYILISSPGIAQWLQSLIQDASTDQLTQAYSRHAGNRKLASLTAPAGLLLIDIDHFKHINDQYGHPAGDRVLVIVCDRICNVLRASEAFVIRWGGDEILVILAGSTESICTQAATRVLNAIRMPIDLGQGLTIHVTASIGCTIHYPGQGLAVGETVDQSAL